MAESDEPSPSYPINGMWFQEDGVTAKVGEPVTLTGAVYQLEPASWETWPASTSASTWARPGKT